MFDHVVADLDTSELARRMVLSEHTVQDHVKSNFAKTSANAHRALVSRTVGT